MAFVRHLKISCLGAAATLVDLSDKAIVAALPYAAATIATGKVMSTTPVAAAAPAAAVTASLRLATLSITPFTISISTHGRQSCHRVGEGVYLYLQECSYT